MQSISNRQLTLLRKLQRKKYRQQEQLFIVEGERAVEQVLENGKVKVKHLFFDEAQRLWEMDSWRRAIQDFLTVTVGEKDYHEITDTETPQGVLALCVIPKEISLDECSRSEGIIVATDRIQDPGNLGTIVRTAAWFGINGLMIGKGTVDLFHPKVVRSTAGATGTVPFRNSDLHEELEKLERRGWEIMLLDAGMNARSLKEIGPTGKQVVVIGNEANGIDKKLFKTDRIIAKIESGSSTPVESLNASIALSIALYTLTG